MVRVVQTKTVSSRRRRSFDPLSLLFGRLRDEGPRRVTIGCCHDCRSNSGGALGSVRVALVSELSGFGLSDLTSLAVYSRLSLRGLKRRGATLFTIVPSGSADFGFLMSVLCSRLFRFLFCATSGVCGNTLPMPIRFLVSRFTGIDLPSSFSGVLSMVHSHNISMSVVVRGVTRLGTLFRGR